MSYGDHWSSELDELKGTTVSVAAEADTGGSYEFDAVAIVKNAAGYHVVSSSGCSCPSHEERARYDAGPFATLGEALGNVGEEHRKLMDVAA